jgi:hypothetical protein
VGAKERTRAAEILGLEVERRNLLIGTVEGWEVTVDWMSGNPPSTSLSVFVPDGRAEFGPPGFKATRRGRVSGRLLRRVSGKREIERADGSTMAVKAKDDDLLEVWLTPARVKALAATRADRVEFWGLECHVSRLVNDPDEIVAIVRDLVATAKVLAGD